MRRRFHVALLGALSGIAVLAGGCGDDTVDTGVSPHAERSDDVKDCVDVWNGRSTSANRALMATAVAADVLVARQVIYLEDDPMMAECRVYIDGADGVTTQLWIVENDPAAVWAPGSGVADELDVAGDAPNARVAPDGTLEQLD
jgi:hypothetical protein